MYQRNISYLPQKPCLLPLKWWFYVRINPNMSGTLTTLKKCAANKTGLLSVSQRKHSLLGSKIFCATRLPAKVMIQPFWIIGKYMRILTLFCSDSKNNLDSGQLSMRYHNQETSIGFRCSFINKQKNSQCLLLSVYFFLIANACPLPPFWTRSA